MRKGKTFGIILILVGIAWLIRQTGFVSVNWLASIKTLWPLFLVALGVSIMAGQRTKLKLGVWVLTFVIILGFGIYKRNEPGMTTRFYGNQQADTGLISLEKEDAKNKIPLPSEAEEGKLILQLGAVKLNLSDGGSELLVNLDSNIPKLEQRLVQGKQTIIEYSNEKRNMSNQERKFNLEMNPNIVWDINANLGATDGKLDLGKIPVRNIELNMGAGDVDLILGSMYEDTNVVLRAGATDLNIYLPESSGLMVKAGKFLTNLSFHNISVTNKDGVYVSENYEKATQSIDIDLLTGVSSINIFAK